MKKEIIDWQINYIERTATCSKMSVSIVAVTNNTQLVQLINDNKIALGFKKINGGDYFCLVQKISDTLLQNRELLPNYMGQLNDAFNENFFKNPLSSKNQTQKVCEVCGVSFTGTGKSKFCSNKCKQANKNAKKEA